MLFFYSEEETKYKGGQKAQKVKQYFSPTSMLISKAVCLFKQYSHMHEIFSSQQCAQIHNYKFSMFCLPVQRKKKKKKRAIQTFYAGIQAYMQVCFLSLTVTKPVLTFCLTNNVTLFRNLLYRMIHCHALKKLNC